MKLPEQKIELIACNFESRYMLQGVLLDVEKEVLVCTDGHVIAVVPAEVEKGDVTGILPLRAFRAARDAVKRLRRGLKKDFKVWVQIQSLKKVLVRDRAASETTVMERPRGQFPKWEGVIPKRSGPPDVVFNLSLLANLVEALAAKGDCDGDTVYLWIDKEKKPTESSILVAVGSSGYRQGIGVLMPMRKSMTAEQALARIAKKPKPEVVPPPAAEQQKPAEVHA